MNKYTRVFLVSLIFLIMFSCGRKGPILPPLIRIPQSVENLTANQVGEVIVLEWENPASYTDDSPLTENREVEIWLYAADSGSDEAKNPPDLNDFDRRGELLKTQGMVQTDGETDTEEKIEESLSLSGEFVYPLQDEKVFFICDGIDTEGVHYSLKIKQSLTKVYVFSLRIKDGKKYSLFSDNLTMKPKIVSLPPVNVRAEVLEDRIVLSWDAPKEDISQSAYPVIEGYNIYRESEGEKAIKRNSAQLQVNSFEEMSFDFGTQYRFYVRTTYSSSSSSFESADSVGIDVEPKDLFPPITPVGLTAIAGMKFISLSWDSNGEDDLEGYHIWRREEGEKDFVLLMPEVFTESQYSDRNIEKNRNYEYTLTAVDINGNESERSEAITIHFREECP